MQIWELFPFAGLGVIGGLLGALFCYIFGLTKPRRPKKAKYQILEAALTAIFTATLLFWAPFATDCKCDTNCNTRTTAPTPAPGASSEPSTRLQWHCPDGDYSELASLLMQSREKSILELVTSDDSHFEAQTLWMLLLVGFTLMSTNFGIAVPAGLFMPTIYVGCTAGRLYGTLLNKLTSGISSSPYALMGACAALGGINRASISLVVIMLEGTGNVHYLLPIILTTMIAKWVGDKINPSVYDIALELKHVPFLEPETTHRMDTMFVEDLMCPDPVCLRLVESVSRISAVLKDTSHNGFPVMSMVEGPSPNICMYVCMYACMYVCM
jgi:chloride channel 7